MCAGVGKSGSPRPKSITSTPLASRAFAACEAAIEADGLMAAMRENP